MKTVPLCFACAVAFLIPDVPIVEDLSSAIDEGEDPFDLADDISFLQKTIDDIVGKGRRRSWRARKIRVRRARITQVPCREETKTAVRIEGETMTCYEAAVPQDFQNHHDSITLTLNVAKIYASETPKYTEPLVVPMGGPGVTWWTADYLHELSVLHERDVWTWDYRGMGLSTPLIECQPLEDEVANPDIATCIKNNAERGINFKFYSTIYNAFDLEAIRRGLRIKSIAFAAVSYGTTVALTYMQFYQRRVSMAAIEGVTWPAISVLYNTSPAALEHVSERATEHCVEDDNCPFEDPIGDAEAFQNRLNTLQDRDLAEYLYWTWMTLTRISGLEGESYLLLFQNAIATWNVPVLLQFFAPSTGQEVVEETSEDDAMEEPLQEPTTFFNAYFMINICFDSGPLISHERLSLFAGDLHNVQVAEDFPSICQALGATDADASNGWLTEMPTSRVSTLVTNGTYDAITPPASAQLIHDSLRNSYIMFLNRQGHSMTAIENSCSKSAYKSFFLDPDNFVVPDCVDEISATFVDMLQQA